MNDFLGYYKWHILFGVIVLICGLFIYMNVTSDTQPDLAFAYVSESHMNVQNFKDAKRELELLVSDGNRDSQRYVEVEAFSTDDAAENLAKLESVIASGKYTAVVADKELFENLKDKSVFVETTQHMSIDEELEYLSDENGRTYATSLENNSLAKRLGMIENSNLYIAAVTKLENGERTSEMKNAMNIIGFFIENKNKYQRY